MLRMASALLGRPKNDYPRLGVIPRTIGLERTVVTKTASELK
jgi:hypothetical protein